MKKKLFLIVIVGGGSIFISGIVLMFLDYLEEFLIRKLKLYDNDKERQDCIVGVCDVFIKEKVLDIEFIVMIDLEEVFIDVDFVMVYIRVGKYVMCVFDE